MKLDTIGRWKLGTSVAFSVIATFAVVLRVHARRLTKAKWSVDDWAVLLGLVAFYAWIGLNIRGLTI